MRISDIDHSQVKTLEEFINVLNCGNPEHIKTEDVSDQSRLLSYLSVLINNEPDSQSLMDREVLVWPGVKQLYTRLFATLDPVLESKANEIFQQGHSYIAGFIGPQNVSV
ncbi:MAG: hypothetical protein KR126chlam2_00079 [Chlamydiae bacterium]|nr:hypothetical protein [Chlamydiota bacterium]